MTVTNDIKDDIYIKLIDYAFKKCDSVMFVSRKDGFNNNEIKMLDNTVESLKNKLGNDLLKTRNGSYYVFTKVGYSRLGITEYKDPPNFDELFEIMFYKTSEETKKYLLTNKNLFEWLNPNYLEDISFFKEGYCWLYSVAHERICEIYCETLEEYNYLKSIGIQFYENDFIKLNKEDLYYENYNL